MPDALGGVLAVWDRRQGFGCAPTEQYVTRFDGAGGQAQHTMPIKTKITLDGGRHAYLTGITAVDVETWATQWTASDVGTPILALDADGLLINSNGTTLVQRANGGSIVSSTPATITDTTLAIRGQGLLHGVDYQIGGLSAIVMPGFLEAAHSYETLVNTPFAPGGRTGAGINARHRNF